MDHQHCYVFRILYGLCSGNSWLIVTSVFIVSSGLLATPAYYREPYKNGNPSDHALKCIDSLTDLNCSFLIKKNGFYIRIGLAVIIFCQDNILLKQYCVGNLI